MKKNDNSPEFLTIGIDARNLINRKTGIGRYIVELCNVLSQLGHSLHLYLPDQPHSLTLLPSNVDLTVSRAPGGILRIGWGLTQLGRIAARNKVDVLWGPAHRLPLRRFLRTPTVLTIHDLVWHSAADTMPWPSYYAEKLLMLPAIKSATKIVTVSNATRAEVAALVPAAAEKIKVVYPGLTKLPINGETSPLEGILNPQKDYALFVGTLEPRKNLLNLLDAYARLPVELRNRLSLVIAGGQGWRMPDLKNEIERRSIENSVILTEYVSDDVLSHLYKKAKFLVMPSKYEGFGLPIIEAQSFGTPVITSNRSSMPEVVGNGGILVDPDDIKSIHDALTRLTKDETLYRKLALNARQNALRFDWQKSGEDLVAVFRHAIGDYYKS